MIQNIKHNICEETKMQKKETKRNYQGLRNIYK